MKDEVKKLKKVILFYNPNAGIGLFKNHLDYIIGRYEKAGYLTVVVRAAYNHMIYDALADLPRETYKDEYHQIVVAGGDGTLNVCVNAMIRNDIDLPLAILPSGTANDFADYFNLPEELDKMLDIALGDHYTYADVGKVNDRYFLNTTMAGHGLGINQATDPALKTVLGVVAYYLQVLAELPLMKVRKVTLTTPEAVYHEEMYFMIVLNGTAVSGLKKVSRESEINDGLLEVMVLRGIPEVEVPGALLKMLRGKPLDSKKVLHFKTPSLLVEADGSLPADIDGEGGETLPLHFSVLHRKLRIYTLEDNMGE